MLIFIFIRDVSHCNQDVGFFAESTESLGSIFVTFFYLLLILDIQFSFIKIKNFDNVKIIFFVGVKIILAGGRKLSKNVTILRFYLTMRSGLKHSWNWIELLGTALNMLHGNFHKVFSFHFAFFFWFYPGFCFSEISSRRT